jgi:hypothetical protein
MEKKRLQSSNRAMRHLTAILLLYYNLVSTFNHYQLNINNVNVVSENIKSLKIWKI